MYIHVKEVPTGFCQMLPLVVWRKKVLNSTEETNPDECGVAILYRLHGSIGLIKHK